MVWNVHWTKPDWGVMFPTLLECGLPDVKTVGGEWIKIDGAAAKRRNLCKAGHCSSTRQPWVLPSFPNLGEDMWQGGTTDVHSANRECHIPAGPHSSLSVTARSGSD